jgi:post-segregation antitoxin (ccd killing protein)
MAKRQTRRSISINRKLHDDMTQLARKLGVSLSSFTEQALRDAAKKHEVGHGG